MILGFLGKGGSGKSSVATQMTLWLYSYGKNVLAIDADHNMDLTFNLSSEKNMEDFPFLGDSLTDIQAYTGLTPKQKYSEIFRENISEIFSFSTNQEDDFTKKYSSIIYERLRLMSSGPQTNQVLYGKSCSHVLTTPLKVYLPLLKLEENENVVLDEKAGADGVTTGIVTGIDIAIIVFEPAIHGIKTALQIANLLDFYNTPYIFVANKISTQDDIDFITLNLKDRTVIYLPFNNNIRKNPGVIVSEWDRYLSEIYKKATEINKGDRLIRTKDKFRRNTDFITEIVNS